MKIDYVINSMLLFSLVGMCIKIFFGNITSKDGSYGRANATIWGYGLIAISVITVMFVSFALFSQIDAIKQNNIQSSIINFIKTFINSSGPALLTALTLCWIIYLNITYFERINRGAVASEYYQLSVGTSFLFLFQIVCLFQYLKVYLDSQKDPKDKSLQSTQSRLTFATYFIASINLIVAGMMTIILEFFSTDG
jgi:hypothetical protein